MTWAKELVLRHEKNVEQIALSSNGRFLICGAKHDGFVYLWDATKGRLISSFSTHSHRVGGVAISSDGSFAAVSAHELQIWDLRGQHPPAPSRFEDIHPRALTFSPDGEELAISISLEGILLWNVGLGAETKWLRAPKSDFQVLEYSSDGLYLAGVDSRSSAVIIWDLRRSRVATRLSGFDGSPLSLHFIRGDTSLVTFTPHVEIAFWDLKTRAKLLSLPALTTFAIAQDGELMADSGEFNARLYLRSGEVQEHFKEDGYVYDVALDPEGRNLYIAKGIGIVTKWSYELSLNEAANDILQSNDWLPRAALFFRGMDFFVEYAALPDAEFTEALRAKYLSVCRLDPDNTPSELELLQLLGLDTARVWWGDMEIVQYDTVYTDTLHQWASISRGAFDPVELHEQWTEDNSSVSVSFNHLGQAYHLSPEVHGDWFDLSIVAEINHLLSPSGYQFCVFEEPRRDQTTALLCLKADERRVFETDLGMSFQSPSRRAVGALDAPNSRTD